MEISSKMPQSRSTALPRLQKKEWWGKIQTTQNTTYEATDAQTKKNCNRGTDWERSVVKLLGGLTLSAPNFRRHLSSAFYFNKLSFGKTFICKVERLNVKQHRSRWDGSMSPMLFAKAYYYRLWQRRVKPVSLARTLIFNAAPYQKCMFSPHRRHLPHLFNITVKYI